LIFDQDLHNKYAIFNVANRRFLSLRALPEIVLILANVGKSRGTGIVPEVPHKVVDGKHSPSTDVLKGGLQRRYYINHMIGFYPLFFVQ